MQGTRLVAVGPLAFGSLPRLGKSMDAMSAIGNKFRSDFESADSLKDLTEKRHVDFPSATETFVGVTGS